MGNLGGPEILVIMVIALIVLGPTKLPEAARQIGRAVTELRRLSSGFQKEMRDALVDPEVESEARQMRKQLSGKVTPQAPPLLAADPTPIPEIESSTSSETGAEVEPSPGSET